jgi:hypothetical protein
MNLQETKVQEVKLSDYNFVTDRYTFNISINGDGLNNSFIYMLDKKEIDELLDTPDAELSFYTIAIKQFVKTNNIEKLKNQLLTKEFKLFPNDEIQQG